MILRRYLPALALSGLLAVPLPAATPPETVNRYWLEARRPK